ncbi:MAG: hypothetical protein CMK59_09665 [Proteobacteria bacterium]|nr:hypothetical protein [Pseudomonadota bacterium]
MISYLLPDNIPEKHFESAEHVRSYLVCVRGGAPFLSGVDGALLVEWLDEDIKASIICAAIDKVALRRRKKRVRTRLNLRSCRGELNKLRKKQKPIEPQTTNTFPLFRKIQEFLLMHPFHRDLSSQTKSLQKKLTAAEKKLSTIQNAQQLESIAKTVINAIRSFHDALWELSSEQHEQLRQSAEEELSSLRNLLGPTQWRDAVEEVMRDSLRAQYPLLTAEAVWNALNSRVSIETHTKSM